MKMQRSQQVTLEIASRLDLLDTVQSVLTHLAALLGFDDDSVHYMGVAVRESVINAIKHGNRFDEHKTVVIAFSVGGGEMAIRIRDQGEGFEPGAVRDPLADENLLRADGRGMFFMRSFMDLVSYQFPAEGGTEVTLVKKVGSPPVSPSGGKR
jgi:serine/threonine-protein kinase RsbW